MIQISFDVVDEANGQLLIRLLSALDFVSDVRVLSNGKEGREKAAATENSDPDFFALAGLWKDRDITLDSLRQSAWPRQ